MGQYKSEFIKLAIERGYVHQSTDLTGLDIEASSNTLTAYIGFDCTAPSLHAGSLVSIMLLRLLQKTGHKPIVLMGGGTSKVGDPSGKEETRKLINNETIAKNMEGIKKNFKKYLTFGNGPKDAIMVNNNDWLNGLDYIQFLRDYGRHFSINRMLGFESIKQRLARKQHLTFLEFNYMVFQAYDFLELARRHNCVLQMGGSDQWGNILNGIELTRRVEDKELFGLTTPLLTTASGVKMGKTAAGAVWLNADLLSPYDYWQYWRNTEDDDVGKFLRLFTEIPTDEIVKLEKLKGSELNTAKKVLADAVTALCHGKTAAQKSRLTAYQTFEKGSTAAGLPTLNIPRKELGVGIAIFELFRRGNLSSSNGEARRLIRGGGARLNDSIISSETMMVSDVHADSDGIIKLSAGKKRHILFRVTK
ncbi:MAG: tyrosine--tRNA ligase [Magnetovibrio sp.]|nr:tyrosine--tRNA ligase [Magnetovibrio sp.]